MGKNCQIFVRSSNLHVSIVKQGHMKERMLERFKFTAVLKEKLVHMMMYHGAEVKDLVKKYRLPHASTLRNGITWIG